MTIPHYHQSPMGTLTDRVVLVVGAGQSPGVGGTVGNGRAAALTYARYGAKVVLADRDADSCRETLELVEEAGGEGMALQADVTSVVSCEELVAATLSQYGRIDVLHNNVGTGHRDSTTSQVDEDAWDFSLEINLTSAYRMMRLVVPVMREQGAGVITNISSVASFQGFTRSSAYAVAKSGLNTLTRLVAADNARHLIRVNAILPGVIDTPHGVDLTAKQLGIERADFAKAQDARVPIGRSGTGWDIAHAAVFLASDAASYITGVTLAVDGGLSQGFTSSEN